jgi:Integrase core domain
VLFERICRKNGIKQRLTRPFSPTMIGKVERWHQSLQTDFLTDAGPFESIEAAQTAVAAWRHEYNYERPHQSLDMATPASRFRPSPQVADDALQLWVPADLEPLTSPPGPGNEPAVTELASWPDAVEVDRVVPLSGNMWVSGQQFWLSPARTGQQVTLWMDTTTVHLSIGGWRVKTVPSRLSEVDLARLRNADARPAGPPPAGPSPGVLAAIRCVEVDRLVNAIGGVTLLNRLVLVGVPLAGQRPGSASTAS